MRIKYVAVSLILLSMLCCAQNAASFYLTSLDVPRYPPLARTARIQGAVEIKISINADGAVVEATVLSGNKMLTEYALTNVKTWHFGQPTHKSFHTTVHYKYILDDHAIEDGDCCRFKVNGPTTVEVYGGATYAQP